jgi:O-antigen/teichoic acid export membrane protein
VLLQRSKPGLGVITLRGAFWTYASRLGGKPIAFISLLFLARFLSKEDFGIAAYAIAIVHFLIPLSDLGIGSSLVYYKDDPETSSTAFWVELFIASVLFGAIWFLAPLMAAFFPDVRAIDATRVLALTFPVSALGKVHESLLQKRLSFHAQLPPALVKPAFKGALAVLFAIKGYGAWSLIWADVISDLFWVLTYWRLLPWKPSFRFNFAKAKQLLRFGHQVTIINLLGATALNAGYFFIGHFMSMSLLGVYLVGFRIASMLILEITYVLGKVLFPVYTKILDDTNKLKFAVLQNLRHVCMITIPLALGAATVARPFVLAFLKEEWAGAVPVMQAMFFYSLILTTERQFSSALKAMGRLSSLLLLSVVRIMTLLPLLWLAAGSGSITLVAWMQTLAEVSCTLVYANIVKRELDLRWQEIVSVIRPAAICAILMSVGMVAVLMNTAALPELVRFVAAVAAGIIFYAASSWWLQRDTLLKLRHTVASVLGGH